MPPIRTIFWDVGGVLLTNGYDHAERERVLDHFGVEHGPVEERHAAANDLWEKGKISVWEFMDRTIFFEPRDFTPQQFFDKMAEQSKLLPATALPVLQSLAAAGGHKIVALSNESAELTDYRLRQFDLRGVFETFLFSAYVGVRKPHPEIYEMALRLTQSRGEESIFIDDRAENIEPAAALGIHGIRYQSPDQLTKELKGLGIETES
jgi:putative hydrolase of the HAD superfamily